MAGVRLYPLRIQNRAVFIVKELSKLKEQMDAERVTYKEFLSYESLLMGNGWNSSRQYIEGIQIPLIDATRAWLEAHKNGDFRFQAAALMLPKVDCLDQDQLERELWYWEKTLAEEESEEEPSYSTIRECRRNIREINLKLRAIESFVRNTSGCYDKAVTCLNILNKADTEIQKVHFDQNTNVLNFTDVNRNWILEMDELRGISGLKADGLTDDQIKEAEDLGFSIERIASTWEELKARDIDSQDIESMEDMALNFGAIVQAWKNTETEADRTLVAGLIKKDYLAAFRANANEVNVKTQIFLTEYVLQASLNDRTSAALQEVLNGMLAPCQDSFPGVGCIGSNANAMSYLEVLYANAESMLKRESLYFLSPNSLTDEGLRVLNQRHEGILALTTMTGSTYDILYGALGRGEKIINVNYITDLSDIRIDNLKYNTSTNAYSYDISYEGAQRSFNNAGETGATKLSNSLAVTTRILEMPQNMRNQLYLESRAKLVEAQEELEGKLYSEFMQAGAVTSISAFNPLAGAAAGFVFAAAEGKGKNAVTSLQKIVNKSGIPENSITKFVQGQAVTFSASAIQSIMDYQKQYNSLSKDIEGKDNEIYLSWFGAGGAYSIGDEEVSKLVVSGIYNPEMIEKIGVWKKEGLEGLAEKVLGENVLFGETPLEEIHKINFIKALNAEEYAIWTGEGVLEMDMDVFVRAVENMGEKYQDETDKYLDFDELLRIRGKKN